MKHIFKTLAASAIAVVCTVAASASPITGSFSLTSFSGTYMNGTSTATAQTATGLDFGDTYGGIGNGYGTNGTALVGNATGSFAGLNGTTASIADIALGTFANPYTANPFVSFGSNSNIVLNFSNASYTRSPLGTSITITGLASFTDGIAADASTGTFSLSTSSQNGSASDVNFTYTSNATAVTPEPNSLFLLGTGLVGTATTLLRRRRMNA